jgi:hypothetical protein
MILLGMHPAVYNMILLLLLKPHKKYGNIVENT